MEHRRFYKMVRCRCRAIPSLFVTEPLFTCAYHSHIYKKNIDASENAMRLLRRDICFICRVRRQRPRQPRASQRFAASVACCSRCRHAAASVAAFAAFSAFVSSTAGPRSLITPVPSLTVTLMSLTSPRPRCRHPMPAHDATDSRCARCLSPVQRRFAPQAQKARTRQAAAAKICRPKDTQIRVRQSDALFFCAVHSTRRDAAEEASAAECAPAPFALPAYRRASEDAFYARPPSASAATHRLTLSRTPPRCCLTLMPRHALMLTPRDGEQYFYGDSASWYPPPAADIDAILRQSDAPRARVAWGR